jgi:hypothetical protein
MNKKIAWILVLALLLVSVTAVYAATASNLTGSNTSNPYSYPTTLKNITPGTHPG